VIGVLAAVALGSFGTQALAKSKDQKLCGDLSSFKASVMKLDELGPNSTIGELKAAAKQARESGQKVAKEAGKDPNAGDLSANIKDLQKAVDEMPSNATMSDAKATLQDEINAVKQSASSFAQSHCH